MLELERPDVRVHVHWGHVHADLVKDGAALDSVVQFASETLSHPRGSDTANEEELNQHLGGSGDGGSGGGGSGDDGSGDGGSGDGVMMSAGRIRYRVATSGDSGSDFGICSSWPLEPPRNHGNKVWLS